MTFFESFLPISCRSLCNKGTLMVKKVPKQETALGTMLLLLPLLLLRFFKWEICYKVYGVKKIIQWKRIVDNIF